MNGNHLFVGWQRGGNATQTRSLVGKSFHFQINLLMKIEQTID